jgi:hypothetical protein
MTSIRLFHFSDDAEIDLFTPRPVAVASPRPPGQEWLNGPLVWAIDERHQPMYLFPRDCPRILVWPIAATTAHDRARLFSADGPRMIAYVERAWVEQHASARLHRYEFPPGAFVDLDDAGMWVSRTSVRPLGVEPIADLPAMLAAQGVELRAVDSLVPLKSLWSTSLHVSGIRLRNAAGW